MLKNINMNPKLKKVLIWGGAILVVVSIVSIVTPNTNNRTNKADSTVKHVLTDFNTREIGVDSLASSIKLLHSRDDVIRRELNDLKRELELIRKNAGLLNADDNLSPQISVKLKEIDEMLNEFKVIRSLLPKNLRRHNLDLAKENVTSNEENLAKTSLENSKDLTTENSLSSNKAKELNQIDEKQAAILSQIRNSMESQNYDEFGKDNEDIYIKKIESKAKHQKIGLNSMETNGNTFDDKEISHPNEEHNNQSDTNNNALKIDKQESKVTPYIPAGTILSGMLLTGLDAPTSENTKNEPFPVLINIDKDAILPNEYSFNLKECFLLAAGYGDMSSERVYLRAESLNCISDSGKVIENTINGYIVGTDGKAGIRGRLVSKQGKLIVRSLMAGFLEGLAGVFDVQQVPTLTTSNNGTVEYQRIYSKQALQGAGASGASKALERVADFYLKLADNMFPVLEIDAARRVDLVLTKGVSFKYELVD